MAAGTIRYWAGARAAAGVHEEAYEGDTLGAVLDAAASASRVLDLAMALGRGGSLDAIGRTRLVVERRVRRLRSWTAAAERRAARAERVA